MRERQSGQVPVEVQNETNALQLDRSLDLDKKNGLASLRSLQLSQRNGVNAGCSYAHLYAPTLVVILAHSPVRPTRHDLGIMKWRKGSSFSVGKLITATTTARSRSDRRSVRCSIQLSVEPA